MKTHEKLLLENKAWAEEMRANNPDYFERMATAQDPTFLWIGCSDSRIPVNLIVNMEPGELFVHRNVANLVVHTDLNLLSVLQYGVENLGIDHIVVCGHYGCGGVNAALSRSSLGLIDKWLRHIKDVYHLHAPELEALDPAQRAHRMVELNVVDQVSNLAKTSIVQRAWAAGRALVVHGMVYDIRTGELRSLINADASFLDTLDLPYRFEL